jgi:hypothetical protein
MNKILGLFISVLFAVSMNSCQFFEDIDKIPEPEVKYASTYPVSGEYYVMYNHADYGEDPFGAGFTKVFITNTAADDGKEIWIGDYAASPDDYGFWQYKVKVPVNVTDLTFGNADAVVNNADGYPIQIKIMNGKIIKDASLLDSGVKSDSIYFEIWFEDLEDATGIADDKLLVSGFRRTGFIEDEH